MSDAAWSLVDLAVAMLGCRQPARDVPRGPGDPPPPTGCNCDVMAVLPDGRRGYFDGVCLWTSTGRTLHSPDEAIEAAAEMQRMFGAKARFFAVDAEYGEWEPICDLDGRPVTRTTCEACGFADVFDGPLCPSCEQTRDD